MTPKQIEKHVEKLENRSYTLREHIASEAGSSLMDLVNELISIEIELESFANV
jgi:hypothetical protein